MHDVVSTSTINKCHMEPRLPFNLRILACKILKKFILKSARPLDILPWRRAQHICGHCVHVLSYVRTHQPQLHAITLGFVT